jgi:sucrose phosphorylase
VHLDHPYNADLAEKGFWGYKFALPLLVQHALHYQTAVNLRRWLQTCPRRQITVLDTHDGVGVDDMVGLIDVSG